MPPKNVIYKCKRAVCWVDLTIPFSGSYESLNINTHNIFLNFLSNLFALQKQNSCVKHGTLCRTITETAKTDQNLQMSANSTSDHLKFERDDGICLKNFFDGSSILNMKYAMP